MKKKYIISASVLSLALLAAIGVTQVAFAQGPDNSNRASDVRGYNLTEEQRTQLEADREARQAERDTRREAVQAALEANDYNAWVEAVGENSPMLDKITTDNFSQLVEVHQHMEAARSIFEDLGIDSPGHGMGPMRGFARHPF